MLLRFTFFFLLSSGPINITLAQEDKSQKINPTVIAFGSCAFEYEEVQAFNAIAKSNAEIFIWLGDMIYADTRDMALMKKKYDEQKIKSEYQNLLKTMPVIGVWDDHDYGLNDGGKYYVQKDESKLLALDFLDAPDKDPRYNRNGLYSSYNLISNEKIIKIILLDTRYFRDTLYRDQESKNIYLPNKTGDILGEEQWDWLENELDDPEVDLFIVGSSIQLVAKEHYYEKWANFPAARERILELVKKVNPTPLLVISGDRHIAEVSQLKMEGLDYDLIDFTSSGLTHTWKDYSPEPNEYRVGELIVRKNFGLIKVDWEKPNPEIRFEVIGINGEVHSEYLYKY